MIGQWNEVEAKVSNQGARVGSAGWAPTKTARPLSLSHSKSQPTYSLIRKSYQEAAVEARTNTFLLTT